MDIETLVNGLRSPAGLPSHPAIFLVLLVLTWTLHIIAVHIMLGSTALSLFCSFRTQRHWQRLSEIMLDTAKIAVSIAIVLGVAPLLFVQTIYDPFWYVSNILSARWVIGFIFILLGAYYAMYHRYFSQHKYGNNAGRSQLSLVVSLLLLLLAGFIMHALTSQMLRPELWMQWYAPDGHIDASGASLHEYNLWRFLYFIGLSVPVVGAWLCAYQAYLTQRGDDDLAYLQWLASLGKKLMSAGGMLALLFYVLWLSTLPETAKGFAVSTGSILGLLGTLALALIPIGLNSKRLNGYSAMLVAFIAVLLIAIAREWLRMRILLGVHDYDLWSYPVNFDGYSTVLFFLTFILLGGPAIAYAIALSWQTGLQTGVYTAAPWVDKLGRYALVSLGIWICQYFLFGFITLA